ncbi:hypothetical protein [Streptomyces tubercidicus]|uniref:hypothetical protein n=1 Tax=Streptomyces tubercidicus TaxID=47759 RepID=UPI0036798408
MSSENKPPKVTVKVTEDILRQAMSEIYNSGHFEMVAEDGTRIFLVEMEDADECGECGAGIPQVPGGAMSNRHHKESCSLYDSSKE